MNLNKKKLVKILFTIFLSLALLFCLKSFDYILGKVLDHQVNNIHKRYINLREHVPNQISKYTPDNYYMSLTDTNLLEQKPYQLMTDENGFIIGNNNLKKNYNNKIDFIFFGGSTTECLYMDQEKRFPYLLSQLLKRRDGKDIYSLNAGVSGNHSIHTLLNLISKTLVIKPKYVFFMNNANDIHLVSKNLSLFFPPESRAIIKKDEIGFKTFLVYLKNLIIPNLYSAYKRFINANIHSSDEFFTLRKNINKIEDMKKVINTDFKSSVKSFIYIVRSWNLEPILLTQFGRFYKEDKYVSDLYKKLNPSIEYKYIVELFHYTNNIIREIAKEENVLLIDLEKELRPFSKNVMYDPSHLNSKGSEIVANYIAEQISINYSSEYLPFNN